MMLATAGRPEDISTWQRAGYLWDLKIDGVRCLARVDDGEATLTARSGSIITARYPEVATALVEQFPTEHVVLDGEITVLGEDGFPSWPRTLKRSSQHSRARWWAQALPAKFVAFDILQVGSRSLRTLAYANRRQILEAEAAPGLQITPMTEDGPTLWEQVERNRLEGMVAKRPDSPYRDGRSLDWVKIKRTRTVTCMVGGTDPGEGSRAPTFGALHLYLLDADQELVPVGKVGSGFSDRELAKVMQALHHPPVIVEVRYLDVSPDGQLRQPVFARLRADADVTECTTSQLT